VPRIHCITYRQMAVLKIMMDKLGKKMATKKEEDARILAALEISDE
jgi:hypothetical protein